MDKSLHQCLRIRNVPITVKRGELEKGRGKKEGKHKTKRRKERSPGKAVVLDKGRPD